MTDNHYKLCDADAEALGLFELGTHSVLHLGIPWEAATLVAYPLLKTRDRRDLSSIIEAHSDCVPLTAQGELLYAVYTGQSHTLYDADDQREAIADAHEQYERSSLIGLPLDLSVLCSHTAFGGIPALRGWGDPHPWQLYLAMGVRYLGHVDMWREYARAMLAVGRIHESICNDGCERYADLSP